MTLFEFQLLAETEKTDYLYEHGVYLGKRKHGASIIILFQVEGFYVEVYYKKYRRFIAKIYCFSSTSLLDPYLEQIDVVHLV